MTGFWITEPSRLQPLYKSTRPVISQLGERVSRLQETISRLYILSSRLMGQTESWYQFGHKASRLGIWSSRLHNGLVDYKRL